MVLIQQALNVERIFTAKEKLSAATQFIAVGKATPAVSILGNCIAVWAREL